MCVCVCVCVCVCDSLLGSGRVQGGVAAARRVCGRTDGQVRSCVYRTGLQGAGVRVHPRCRLRVHGCTLQAGCGNHPLFDKIELFVFPPDKPVQYAKST